MQQEFSSKRKLSSSKQPRVGVVCGGTSSERKISRKSGRAVYRALKQAGYQVRLLDPARTHTWLQDLKKIDVAFIALHGAGGEDGAIQKVFERKKIAYVGSGPSESYLAYDKILSKKCFNSVQIPTAEWQVLGSKALKESSLKIKVPFFVKPPQEGSSIGIYEVTNLHSDWPKVKRSIKKYRRIMIEKSIRGPEYTVGILGNEALPVIELRPKHPFYDFHAKYTRGMTEYLVPAPISESLRKHLQKLALRVYRALGLRDLARIDFKVDKEKGKPFVLEANSIPGFTEFSLLPKAALSRGISFPELCSTLIGFACNRKGKQV